MNSIAIEFGLSCGLILRFTMAAPAEVPVYIRAKLFTTMNAVQSTECVICQGERELGMRTACNAVVCGMRNHPDVVCHNKAHRRVHTRRGILRGWVFVEKKEEQIINYLRKHQQTAAALDALVAQFGRDEQIMTLLGDGDIFPVASAATPAAAPAATPAAAPEATPAAPTSNDSTGEAPVTPVTTQMDRLAIRDGDPYDPIPEDQAFGYET
jgi:hypothetical protein